MNYDNIRVGHSLEIEAKRFSENQVKNLDAEQAAIEQPAIYAHELDRLNRQFNEQKIASMPASSITLNDENKDTMVIRYSLKLGVTALQALDVLRRREQLFYSAEFGGDQSKIDSIMADAFDAHEITLTQAVSSPDLKRNPYELTVEKAVDEKASIKQSSVSNPFQKEKVVISGEALTLRLDQLNKGHADLAKELDQHHKTVDKWTRDGVPDEFVDAVLNALA